MIPSAMFTRLLPQPSDPLLALIGLYRSDPRPAKIDLGVGVYRDEHGVTPVLGAIKAAERHLLEHQGSKSYLGPEGDVEFVEQLSPLIFGADWHRPVFGVQTPGGTGALRLAFELLQVANPELRVFIGAPTWPNHTQMLDRLAIETIVFRHYDQQAQRLCFDELMANLETARHGDVVVLQACCHNPTGADYSLDQWAAIAEVVARKGITPLIDLAYQGLALGFDEDAQGLRLVVEAADDSLVAYSCDKNFGLYRERTGALYATSRDAGGVDLAASNMRALTRSSWSMPPDHGAAAVRIVLQSPELTRQWREELSGMRLRIADLRERLARAAPSLRPLADQHGLFALLPLSSTQVARMREDHAIYMASSGRINLAGLTQGNIDTFAQALQTCLQGAPQ